MLLPDSAAPHRKILIEHTILAIMRKIRNRILISIFSVQIAIGSDCPFGKLDLHRTDGRFYCDDQYSDRRESVGHRADSICTILIAATKLKTKIQAAVD